MPVLIHYLKTRTPNGSTRYSEELLAALQRIGVDARANTPYHKEFRLGKLRVGGSTTLRLSSSLPVLSKKIVHATQYYYNPPWRPADVVTIHDIMPVVRPELYGLSPRGLAKHTRLVRRALQHSEVMVSSRNSKEEVLAHFPEAADPERIHAVPLGVDKARFYPAPSKAMRPQAFRPGMLNVVVVMNAERRKRLDLLLQAAIQLPFVNVVHAGPWRPTPAHRLLADKVEPLAGHLSKEGRYVRLGAVSDEELRHLYSEADVVVQPTMAEGFGLPPLEALACGARVIASDIPSHREVLQGAARLVALEDGVLAAELQRAWDGAKVRDSAFPAHAARLARAAEFTWEKTARQAVGVYAHVKGKTL